MKKIIIVIVCIAVVATVVLFAVAKSDVISGVFGEKTVTFKDVVPQTLDPEEYVYGWWPKGFSSANFFYIQSGKYVFAIQQADGSVTRMGSASSDLTHASAAKQSSEFIDGLYMSKTEYRVDGTLLSSVDTSGIESSGTYMQRIKKEFVLKDRSIVDVFVTYSALPDYFTLSISGEPSESDGELLLDRTITVTQTIDPIYSKVKYNSDNTALTCYADSGEGITFILIDGQVSVDGNTVIMTKNVTLEAEKNDYFFNAVIIPSRDADIGDSEKYIDTKNGVTVEYVGLTQTGKPVSDAKKTAEFDMSKGVFVLDVDSIESNTYTEEAHMNANRCSFTVTNPTREEKKVYLGFNGNGTMAGYIVGGAPMIRDINGEPVGIPVQISKNWHDAELGEWYNLYSVITVPPMTSTDYELTIATAKWGETYAASHAQLCLYGWSEWSGSQLWDESALGIFGEHVTYDPDVCQKRSMIDDVRPFLVYLVDRQKYTWTGNVGGADFLKYDRQKGESALKNVKTDYIYNGPNLTKVLYSGISYDDKISAELLVQLGRTNDVNRNFYTLDYYFNEDVSADRLVFFQVAADGYKDNNFTQREFGIDDTSLGTNTDTVVQGSKNGDLWGFLYDSNASDREEDRENGNVLMIIRSYKFTDGKTGEVTTTPVMQVNNGQVAFEVIAPKYLENNVPAGSKLELEIEYVITPAAKEDYYGDSDYINAMAPEDFNSAAMAVKQAVDGKVSVSSRVGEIQKSFPIEIKAELGGEVVAEFTVTGGLGYIPLTIKGLDRHNGWELQYLSDGDWQRVDQSSSHTAPSEPNYANNSNDFWQCNYDTVTESYELTYNVQNQTSATYRLVKK